VDNWQVWLNASMKGVTGNCVDISGWSTTCIMVGTCDLIEDNNWMATNLHIINQKTNTLHMLEPDRTDLQQGSNLLSPTVMTSHEGLRPYQGQLSDVQANYRAVANR